MKSIIKEIFYGNRGQSDKIKPSEEYRRLMGEFVNLYEELIKLLPEDKKADFINLCNLQDDMEAEAEDTCFTEGVKLGILLGIEACS